MCMHAVGHVAYNDKLKLWIYVISSIMLFIKLMAVYVCVFVANCNYLVGYYKGDMTSTKIT